MELQRLDVTAWIGVGAPGELLVIGGQPAILVDRRIDLHESGRVEVSLSTPRNAAVRSMFFKTLHRGPASDRFGPVAVSPSGDASFHILANAPAGVLSNGTQVPLPRQPFSAALGDAGELWVSFLDGSWMRRGADGATTTHAVNTPAFLTSGPDGLVAGSTGERFFVRDANWKVLLDAPIRTGHFAFHGRELFALEANGPVWLHRIHLATGQHRRTELPTSIHIAAIDPLAREAVTHDERNLILIDVIAGAEIRSIGFPPGFEFSHVAFDPKTRAIHVLGHDGRRTQWWLTQVR